MPELEGAVKSIDSALVPDAARALTASVPTSVSVPEIVASADR